MLGTIVTAISSDNKNAEISTSANGRNNADVSPDKNPKGKNATTSVEEIAASTGASRVALALAAFSGASPSCTRRKISSTTTIASSTTSPTASTSAMMVNRFNVCAVTCITIAAPSSDSKIARNGAAAARIVPSDKRTINPTSRIVMTSVYARSVSDCRTLTAVSYISSNCSPGGTVGCIDFNIFENAEATVMIFPVGAIPAARYTHSRRSHHEIPDPAENPICALAKLRSGTVPPPCTGTGSASKAAGVSRPDRISTCIASAALRSTPPEFTAVALLNCAATSAGVIPKACMRSGFISTRNDGVSDSKFTGPIPGIVSSRGTMFVCTYSVTAATDAVGGNNTTAFNS